MSAGGSLKVILGSLVGNVVIAGSKFVAAAITGSGSMLAEAIHSSADCTNQLLLLIGAKQASAPASEAFPMGRGRAAYFWAFAVALMVMIGGGVFSIREGFHKLSHPEPVENLLVAYVVLGVAVVIEAVAALQCFRAIQSARGKTPFFKYLSFTKDLDVVVLFAENTAALFGLLLAIIALVLAQLTGDVSYDAYGSIAIGVLLGAVAIWLAKEAKSSLDGEAADEAVEIALREEVAKDGRFKEVLRVIALQQGPGQVMVAAKLRIGEDLPATSIVAAINDLETRMRTRCPDVKWQFIEPDLEA